jgi:hypothetical protein
MSGDEQGDIRLVCAAGTALSAAGFYAISAIFISHIVRLAGCAYNPVCERGYYLRVRLLPLSG